ncbi:MAG TPA: VOC family protein, partial [Myxococcota bacterium]|nr:VOC family protein [Myxococcota bacterium]
ARRTNARPGATKAAHRQTAAREAASGRAPAAPAQSARSEPKASGARKDWEIESIFHFTVNATNFERSLAFYQAIGFKLLRDNRDAVWPDYVAENFGMKRAQGRGALLAIDSGPLHTRLDLIEWLEPAYDPPPDKPWSERVPRIIALRTRNVHAAYEDLSAKGIEFITRPRNMDPNSGIVGVMLCRDPDGLLVEFIEYEPGLLGSRVGHLAKRA